MPKKLNLVGKRFGKLTVIEETDPVYYGKDRQKQRRWLCQCDCGNIVSVTTGGLRNGTTQSCGCSRYDYYDSARENLVGKKYNRLTVIKEAERDKHGHRQFECLCDCGNTTVVDMQALKSGNVRSCGCLLNEVIHTVNKTHGESKSRLYRVWCSMLSRCYNEKSLSYQWYGARGITVCEAWHQYVNFRDWAMPAGYDPDAPRGVCTIDRIDPNGPYCPENCRWADAATQTANRRINLDK